MKYITLDEIIAYVDEQCPNTRTREEKIRWISELDELIYQDIIKSRLPIRCIAEILESDIDRTVAVYLTLFDYNTLLGTSGQEFNQSQIDSVVTFTVASEDVGKLFGTTAFNGYNDNAEGATVLLVPAMFKDIYIYWIEKNISIINREIGTANNANAIFQSTYEDYFSWYNRNNRTIKRNHIII